MTLAPTGMGLTPRPPVSIYIFGIILKQRIVLNGALIGSSNSEYPLLFTSDQLGKNGVPVCIRDK